MTEALAVVESNPALAWSALERSGASHVIVHRRAYLAPRAADSRGGVSVRPRRADDSRVGRRPRVRAAAVMTKRPTAHRGRGAVCRADAGDDVAAHHRPGRIAARRSRRLAPERLHPVVGREAPRRVSRRRPGRVRAVVAGQYLSSRAVRAGLLGAPVHRGRDGVAGVAGDAQRDPCLQRRVPCEHGALRSRDVPAGARAHGQRGRGVARRACLRVSAVPPLADSARAGDVVGVDALDDLRLPALLRRRDARRRWSARSRRCSRSNSRAATS